MTKEKAEQNRAVILETASRLFRTQGIQNVSVADIMQAAGFTHGGFYNHFASKEELAAQVVASSFHNAAKHLSDKITMGSEKGLKTAISEYLSPTHRDACAGGCPASALPVDAARNGEDVQGAYADGIEAYIDIFSAQMNGDKKQARQEAIAVLSGMVGAMVLARAVRKSEPKLSDELLSAARKHFAK
nr:TetR/AcrR family transcriptional regulator [Bradyrhizobium sp. BR 10289]